MKSEFRTGLLGEVLGHSISPILHGYMGDEVYRLFEVKPAELDTFLRSDNWDAINVTMPYKKAVIPYCASLSDRAELCGAVNVLVKKDGKIYGDNTDYAGFCHLCEGIPFREQKVVILGSGGAATMARAASLALGAREVVIVSRSGEVRYAHTERYADADILINATPLGMYPNVDACPIDLTLFSRLCAVVDLIANPLRTALMQKAEKLGIAARGGLKMLCTQAHEARRVFTGTSSSLSREALYRRARLDTENIVLVGMPGSGKTTFAAYLAEKFGRKLFDTDALIEKESGLTIPEIFRQKGEKHFRLLEQETIARLSPEAGVIIATGGGAVLSDENRRHLRQNSFVIHIDCPPEELSREGRPLSGSPERLREMAQERAAYYREAADAYFLYTKQDRQAFPRLISLIEQHREAL